MLFGIHVIIGTFSDDILFLMSISSISLPRSSVEQEILTSGLKDEEVKTSDIAEDLMKSGGGNGRKHLDTALRGLMWEG